MFPRQKAQGIETIGSLNDTKIAQGFDDGHQHGP
jgi:hypothetical protein